MNPYQPNEVQEITVSGSEGSYKGYIRFTDGEFFSFDEAKNDSDEQAIIAWLYKYWQDIDWSREATADGLMEAMQIRKNGKSRSFWRFLLDAHPI